MALFAVITKQNPVGISADEFRHRLPEGFTHHVDLVSRGVIKHSWIIAGQSGGLNIYDVASHEELTDALYGNPLSSHLEFDVYPLSDPGGFDVEEFATRDAEQSAN
ncbi:muconolactone Delta-isomerase family protein [Nocardia sp. AG03]|uniref:muconolactone Delta-isomerase family protein n=1 Tax=Nocardia sp. AG03 TaxID=3025312 RepID=UPI002418383D|nr:muconolactone Delta-isomerase family protein [Nocardia sp. AG03]